MKTREQYAAVTQMVRYNGEVIAPELMVPVLQFECHYCEKITVVDPNNADDAAIVANMLKVQTADGKAFAFCDTECAKPGMKFFKQNPLVPVNDGKHFAESESNIVLTDAEYPAESEVQLIVPEEYAQ